ncbi:MAG TPA: molybdenum cofactor guanylyltransferase [Chitinophagaceae bacterium]|nr:molybdenum cofactor guanylyltransferase [Chitinophagaceae bacterium]
MNQIQAFILAGGNSSRMGSEKGMMLYRNRPLISYVVDAVLPFCNKISLLTSHPAYEFLGLPMIPDQEKGLGPAGAIATLLECSQAIHNLIVPCDMPFLQSGFFSDLYSELGTHDIIVPLKNQRPECLPGIYSTAIVQPWKEYVKQGERKLSVFLSHFHTTFVHGEAMELKYPRLFTNMNTPNDLQI